ESTQQSGFSHAIPRIALTQSGGLDAAQARSLWQQGFDPKRPMRQQRIHYRVKENSDGAENNDSRDGYSNLTGFRFYHRFCRQYR
ncbi:hypothetical protein MJM59_33060, partial [Salmonella enterica subsp. enterica serovar Montevideo]|nr:hypothetical protein [Salmonella enterica subsp. enterica serovar Montevideo]